LGRQKVLENGILPTYEDAFWEKNGFVSKAFIHAEILLLKESIPSPVARKRNSPFRINSDVLSVVGVLRNLHKTMHPQQCFKPKKNSDCRMKLPDCEKVGMEIHYDKEDTPWYDWKGIKNGGVCIHIGMSSRECQKKQFPAKQKKFGLRKED